MSQLALDVRTQVQRHIDEARAVAKHMNHPRDMVTRRAQLNEWLAHVREVLWAGQVVIASAPKRPR